MSGNYEVLVVASTTVYQTVTVSAASPGEALEAAWEMADANQGAFRVSEGNLLEIDYAETEDHNGLHRLG